MLYRCPIHHLPLMCDICWWLNVREISKLGHCCGLTLAVTNTFPLILMVRKFCWLFTVVSTQDAADVRLYWQNGPMLRATHTSGIWCVSQSLYPVFPVGTCTLVVTTLQKSSHFITVSSQHTPRQSNDWCVLHFTLSLCCYSVHSQYLMHSRLTHTTHISI